MTANILVTTSIPYVNAKPHIGHAQEFILADAIARLQCAIGHHVILQSGTDENAFKNVLAAHKAGESPNAFVQRHSQAFRELLDRLNVSYDTFIRTSEQDHARGVHLFWERLNPDDLYEKPYRGLYCVGCEDFYQEKDLIDGLCPDHKTPPQEIEERNVFFRLSRYQDRIAHLIANDTIRIAPSWRKNEILSFIERGLQDISLTRDASRAQGWGIPAPGLKDQIIYVWIDALVNYLTGQGLGTSDTWSKVWHDDVRKIHVIGKNVWKFHAIYWPALLLSAGFALPNDIVIHGFLTANGEKISKSLGNGVDPIELIDRYGADPLRHFLLHAAPLFGDADFSEDRLKSVYNADLANKFGNLVSRLVTLKEKAQIAIPPRQTNSFTPEIRQKVSDFDVPAISAEAWEIINEINNEVTARKPWELLRDGKIDDLKSELHLWFDRLCHAVQILESFIPEATGKFKAIISRSEANGPAILFPRK